MEEKKFEIIKAGTRVHEKENPKHVGTVVIQAETTGKCLVKLDACSPDAYTAGGLLREPRGIWLLPDALVVEEEPETEYVPDIRKNWALSFHCVNGKTSYVMRYESEIFANGWINAENLTPTEAVRDWAKGKEMETEYKRLCGESVPEKEEEDEPDEVWEMQEFSEAMKGFAKALLKLAEG